MLKVKKISAAFLAVLIIISACPFGLFGLTASAAASGTTGGCTWVLDGTRLTISGNGRMEDYHLKYDSPWGSQITEVIIEYGVTSIGDIAFGGCDSLTNITIPNSVTSIGYSAFEGCALLTNITIPNSVTNIYGGVFSGCQKLESIKVAPDNSKYHDSGNCIIETETKVLIAGCKNSIMPSDGSVTSIGDSAFSGCNKLKKIAIPNGVTSIGDSAFSDCTSLTKITIPDCVTSIGSSAFSNCSSLMSVTIPNSVASINWYVFSGCTSLTNITIPENVTKIGSLAFSGCTSLISISIPDSVTSIGSEAFLSCYNIRDVNISDISKWVNIDFSGSSNPLQNGADLYLNGSKVVNLFVPETVTAIKPYAFSGCSSIESITIPNSVTEISENAFASCSDLKKVTLPNSISELNEGVFSGCYNLTDIFIPKSLEAIYNGAFASCGNIQSIYFEGNENEWNDIVILPNNGGLQSATVHFNSNGIPGAIPSAPELLAKTSRSVTLKPIPGNEYRLNNGEWQADNVFTGLNPNTEYKFFRRTAACANNPAGDASYALTVATSEIIAGDINDDGEVNILDLIGIKKFFADPGNNIIPSDCLDVSGDGIINCADLAALKKIILMQ